jgi:Na+/H+-translocating membrane pyrophosphatase
VRRQFTLGLLDEGSTVKPDYARCVEIVTRSSLRQMIAPVWMPTHQI